MSAFALYGAVSALLLWMAHRLVGRITRLAALALFLLPLAYTGNALLTNRIYAPVDLPYQAEPMMSVGKSLGLTRLHNATLSDVYDQEIPWRKAMRDALSKGEWPLLNPYMMCGDILAAAGQPAVYSPFHLLGCILPLDLSLTFSAAITFFLAGLCAFLFLRDLEVRESIALVAAAGWMYCSFLVFYLEWPLTPAASLLPLLFLSVRRVTARRDVHSAALLTVTFVLLLLAGHPESALHVVAVSAAFGLFEWLRRREQILRTVSLAVASGITALLVCAIYLLPLLAALPQTMEDRDRREIYANRYSAADPATIQARLLSDVFPFANGNSWEGKMAEHWAPEKTYAGVVLLAPALFFLWRGRRRERWFFAGLALFGVLAGAEVPPVSSLLKRLPLFNIALNQRLVFVASFAFVVLAALGLELWCETHDDLRMAASFALIAALVASAIALVWYPLRALEYTRDVVMGHALLSLVPLAAGAVIFLARARPRVAIPLVLLLLLAQRVGEDGATYPTLDRRLFYPHVPLFDAIRRDRGPFRIVGKNYTFIPNTSAMYDLEDARGYEAMTLLPFASTYSAWSVYQPVWFNRVDDLSRPFLSFLNIRYAIAGPKDSPPPGWHLASTQPGAQLFENDRAIDRFFIPRKVRYTSPGMDVLHDMMASADFRERSWLSASGQAAAGDVDNGSGTLAIRSQGLSYSAHASMKSEAWVVISQAAWNGWRATLDGAPVPIRLANLAFLAVHVPAGEHEIRLVYLPSAFVLGRRITFMTLALLFAIALLSRVRKP